MGLGIQNMFSGCRLPCYGAVLLSPVLDRQVAFYEEVMDPAVSAKMCSVENCAKKHLAGGLCSMHYERQRRTGTTDTKRKSTNERFWSKVNKHGPDDCWEWLDHRYPSGYAWRHIKC